MEVEFTGNFHMGCSPSKLQFKENIPSAHHSSRDYVVR
jgi:hypothetical protein